MCTPPRFLIPITDDLQPRAHLPSYEEVLLQNEYEYSGRLPTYQFRSLRRYHPYLRFIPPSSLERPSFARYYVCDMPSIFLQVFLTYCGCSTPYTTKSTFTSMCPPLNTTVRSFNDHSDSYNSLRIPQSGIVPPIAPPTAAALGPVAQAHGEAAAPHLEVDEARIQRLGDLMFVCRSEYLLAITGR